MELKIDLLSQIQEIIIQAREKAIRSVDYERVLMYWQIGNKIFEEEQQGKDRAEYGSFLIKTLALELEPHFGSGFSVRQLELCRQFYKVFQNTNALHSHLNWTQYKLLIRIDSHEKREFYIAEASKNNWLKI
jgi:hypothetical protein